MLNSKSCLCLNILQTHLRKWACLIRPFLVWKEITKNNTDILLRGLHSRDMYLFLLQQLWIDWAQCVNSRRFLPLAQVGCLQKRKQTKTPEIISEGGIGSTALLALSSKIPHPGPPGRWRCAALGPSWWLLEGLCCCQPGSHWSFPPCCLPGSVRETSESLKQDRHRHSQRYTWLGLGKGRRRTVGSKVDAMWPLWQACCPPNHVKKSWNPRCQEGFQKPGHYAFYSFHQKVWCLKTGNSRQGFWFWRHIFRSSWNDD